MKSKAVKTVSFMVFATLIAKLLGMLRDIFFANSYGTSMEAAAYLNASRIPLLFFDLTLGAAILSTFIPVFNRYIEKDDRERALRFSHSFINLIALISIVFCIIGVLFAQPLANMIAPGMSFEARQLTASLLIILLPTTVFTALAYCFVGILQSFDEFNIPAIISIVSNGSIIIYLLFFNKHFGIYGVAVAMLIGWSLQVFVQVPSLIKKGYRYRFKLDLKDEGIKEVFILALPILVSSWIQPICFMINTIFASYLNGGQAVSALDYANRLYIIVVGVFTFGITNYIFPSLSRMSGAGDDKGFTDVMRDSLSAMFIIIAPIMAGMIILARPLINVIYMRGQFTETSAMLTSTALVFYSVGMVAFGLNEILNKCFYAMKNAKMPMYASIAGIITAGTLSFVFTKVFYFRIGGLALSASIAAIVISCILLINMHNVMGNLINKGILLTISKIGLSTIVMAAVVLIAKGYFARFGNLVELIVPTIIGMIVYFAMLFVLKVEQLKEVFNR